MKVNRLLTDAEAREVIKEVSARDGKHREIPLRREGGELTQEKLDAMVNPTVLGEVKKYNHNHGPDGRFTSGPSRGTRGHVTAKNVDKYVSQEDHRKYGVSKALIMKDTKCSEKEAEEYQQRYKCGQSHLTTSDECREASMVQMVG